MSKVIRRLIEGAKFVYNDDEVLNTWFDEGSGLAKARFRAGTCLSQKQVTEIRESDLWDLAQVHPVDEDHVDVHVVEVMVDEDTED